MGSLEWGQCGVTTISSPLRDLLPVMAGNAPAATQGVDPMAILPDTKALQARIAELEAKLKAKERAITLKVSEKGCVSLYGFGRFPVSLYGNQWQKLIEMAPEITAYIEANKDKISFDKNKAA